MVELAALAPARSEHHLIGRLQVFLVTDLAGVSIIAVCFPDDGEFELGGKLEERVTHLPHLLRLVKPSLHLGRIGLHLGLEVIIYHLVLLVGVGRRAVEAFLHDGEAVEHLGRDVQREHGHQDDIHQVNHLLARRDRFFLYCHVCNVLFLRYQSKVTITKTGVTGAAYSALPFILAVIASIMRA